MLKITRLTTENLSEGCVTDNPCPRFAFALESDRKDVRLAEAVFSLGDWSISAQNNVAVYSGDGLAPFSRYRLVLHVTDNYGDSASEEMIFETGRMDKDWRAKWITDGAYTFIEKGVSPRPMTFKKELNITKKIKSAKIYSTALGIYELAINGDKVGKDYFAPGFTSYRHDLQYQVYDVTDMLTGSDTLTAVVAGGWAVGSFVFTRKNRWDADRQTFLAEIRIEYEDGTVDVTGTDETWLVTGSGNYVEADFYDGETYDGTVDLDRTVWRAATVEKLRVSPRITAAYGDMVRAHEIIKPVSCVRVGNELIYDFGQNFAGVISATVNGKAGQSIVFRHAEILNSSGTLNTKFLRSAKAAATYKCRDGVQTYSPRLTYMGFRYVSVSGIEEKDICITAIALYSDIKTAGSFSCSNEMLNKLQSNIVWSAKSNFMDIPTDCPQRDERMGWTGDIAVFSRTACYNFNMSRFLDKWLRDVKSEQRRGGGIPNTVPAQGYGFPATMPVMAVDFWGDACILVPWAEYLARGDKSVLKKMYPTMKKYVNACKFWAGLFSFGKKRYIWNTPGVLHFGDWVAPDLPKMQQWQARRTWTATASLANTTGTLSKIAGILGEKLYEKKYAELSAKVKDAYVSVLTDGHGKLINEFQTAYVLPLYFDIFTTETKQAAADNLARLVEESNYCVGTGFPGTPYILFALADNGHADIAYKMLLNTKCPSWLYEVKVGATTVWERWDGLDENGECPIGDSGTSDVMISYNHYASGAVGDFLYRRIAGIEATDAGYRTFSIKPLVGGGLTFARGSVETPYGNIVSDWKLIGGKFIINIEVPVGTTCTLTMPDGSKETTGSGKYMFETKESR